MRDSQRLHWAPLLALALTACEETPLDPLTAGTSAGDVAVSAALDGSTGFLISPEALELATLEVLAGGSMRAAVEALMLEVGDLEADAAVAFAEGDVGSAAVMASWQEAANVETAVAALGPDAAGEWVAGVEVVLVDVEVAAAAHLPSAPVRTAIVEARIHVDRARSALSSGNDVVAVEAALEASAALRPISLESYAKHVVHHARRLLNRAIELAGPDPRPRLAEYLRQGNAHCEAAEQALEVGRFRVAIEEGERCANIARTVIRLLSGGVPNDRLEAVAEAAIAHAEELFARAVELAGDDPEPRVALALDRAEEALRWAKEAFEEEEWRVSIWLARESAALSKRVIVYLTYGDPSIEKLAAHALAHATHLYERVIAFVGDDVPPAAAPYLTRARFLIDQAAGAFEAGRFRATIAYAREAVVALHRAIRIILMDDRCPDALATEGPIGAQASVICPVPL